MYTCLHPYICSSRLDRWANPTNITGAGLVDSGRFRSIHDRHCNVIAQSRYNQIKDGTSVQQRRFIFHVCRAHVEDVVVVVDLDAGAGLVGPLDDGGGAAAGAVDRDGLLLGAVGLLAREKDQDHT